MGGSDLRLRLQASVFPLIGYRLPTSSPSSSSSSYFFVTVQIHSSLYLHGFNKVHHPRDRDAAKSDELTECQRVDSVGQDLLTSYGHVGAYFFLTCIL